MIIYTSYFAQTKKLVELNIQPISVALYTPEWFNNPIMIRLQPPSSILYHFKDIKRNISGDLLSSKEKLLESQKHYSIEYITMILKNQDPQHIYNIIQQWSGGKDVALCCFEKPSEFCHRQLIAAWLNKHVNAGITEYSF